MKSPSAKSEPVRGTKLTLARMMARSESWNRGRRLISLRMKPAAPFELMLSNRGGISPGASAFPRFATSPRLFTAVARMSPRNTHE